MIYTESVYSLMILND